jgi:hypothetical protein
MNVTLQDLPRVKAGTSAHAVNLPTDELNQERLLLATRAASLLGYHALTADVTGERVVGIVTGRLTETLRQLDIEVLDTESVLRYQMAELSDRNLASARERFSDYATGWFSNASWTHTELTSYQQPVPEFVLEKAIRVKEALPEVKFFVQHLTEPKADPFLIAKLDREVYYVEAWDEPRFEGRMTTHG